MTALLGRILSSQEVQTDMGRRRGQKTGSLTKKGPSWFLRWREDARDVTGRVCRAQCSMVIADAVGPFKVGKREAERIAWDLVLSKLDVVSTNPGSMLTVSEFVRTRFENDHMATLKPAGREHYAYILSKHVLPYLGRHRLRDVNPLVLQDFFRTKRDHYSGQTLTHFRNVISAVFRHAENCGLFSGKLPTQGLKLPKIEAKERSALTAEQATRIIAALPGQYSTLAALLVTTGLRIGEAAGLKWKRVDFALGNVEIRETYSKGRWVSPKTENSVRTVPVPRRILDAIDGLRGRAGYLGPDDPVFVTTHGNPVGSHTAAAKVLKPVAKALGMPWVCWHSFRHSNATFADQQGLGVAGRRKLLGHGSDAMAMRYTHPEMELARVAVEGIAAAVMPLTKERVM